MTRLNKLMLILSLLIVLVCVQVISITKVHAAEAKVTQKDIQAIVDLIAPPQPVTFTYYLPQEINIDDPDWGAFSQGLLNMAQQPAGTKLHLMVTGIGGDVITVFRVARSLELLKQSGVEVDMEVSGEAVSGHAALLCVADKVTVDNGSSVVFHNEGGYTGYVNDMITTRELNQDPADLTPYYTLLQKCISKKILTQEQFQQIQEGKRVVFISQGGSLITYTTNDYDIGFCHTLQELAYLVLCIASMLIFIGLAKRI